MNLVFKGIYFVPHWDSNSLAPLFYTLVKVRKYWECEKRILKSNFKNKSKNYIVLIPRKKYNCYLENIKVN